ncbi:MAG: (2Fe-2S)-binding protein [Ignavibacteria bacterium]|nr:(2Fe-2S)-binding protein [Ignavibacteria bacterium]
MKIKVNKVEYNLDVESDMPLLWVLRDLLKLTGTKYGCGIGVCKVCTVLIDGVPEQSCLVPIGFVEGKEVTTIEGISQNGDHPLQKAWNELSVSQCGYCQPGQIIRAYYLISKIPKPTIEDINREMSEHICRCGTYNKIREAILLATKE